MLNVSQEEELELAFGSSVISASLSKLQGLFVNHRETPEGFLCFLCFFFFLKGITQVGDYTAARNGNWPDFASCLHANGATILQQAGCRPKHLCGERSTRCTSHSWPLCVSLFGKDLNLLNFEPKDLWLNLKMTYFLTCGWMHVFDRRTCAVGKLILFFFFWLFKK